MNAKRISLLLAMIAAVMALGALAIAALPATGDDDPDTCFTYAGTTTCQDAAAVAEHGIYIAIVTCDPDSAEIHGIVPGDATRISAVGADSAASATAAPDGTVSLTVSGADLTGLALDNGHTAPLALSADCTMPSPPSP
jgi:hypothetical protein